MAKGLTRAPDRQAPRRRRSVLIGLGLVVLAVHGCVMQQLRQRMADLDSTHAMPARMEVAYVRDMALSAPPPLAAPAPPAPLAAPKRAPARPASAAEAAASEPTRVAAEIATPSTSPAPDADDVGESVAMPRQTDDTADGSAEAASAVLASAVPAAAAASAVPAAFEWPASTRISYGLTGNYRGEVSGSAQVEWVRVGTHYQVHLDLVVGPSFAPLVTRRMSSDGEITAAGLAPRRYDQETHVVLTERRRVTLSFEPGSVVLANGERRDTVPGIQDTASQFVQLTYVFSTQPQLLRAGGTVDIPLALPHKVDVWTYDVTGEEELATAFGPLASIHLKPRRPAQGRGELSAEIWFAPQLRYLPVRIRIRQDAETYIDMLIAKRPELGQ